MTPQPPRVVHLDELERVPGPGSLTWLPVRLALDVRAFGCNAYVAPAAGEDVVDSHTEGPELAHQELYFVATGRARFTIDEREYDTPAGSYVFVPDPLSHRHAVALEDGTTVLSFGGPPTFEPSAWEWSARASPLMRGEPERARAILADGLAEHPAAASLHYALACLEAVEGDRAGALRALRRAIELAPKLAPWAREDDDLADLHDDATFRELVGE